MFSENISTQYRPGQEDISTQYLPRLEHISTQYLPRVEATLRPMSWVTSRMLEAAATVSSLLSSSTCVANISLDNRGVIFTLHRKLHRFSVLV